MEIERTPNEMVKFVEVYEAGTFSFEHNIYMKIYLISDEQEANAVDISNGSTKFFTDETIVELVFGKFVID